MIQMVGGECGGDGTILYLDCGGSYMDLYMNSNL